MKSFVTDFYFLGERTYVHGPTILGAFLAMVDQWDQAPAWGREMTVLSCRFRQRIGENGTVISWVSGEDRPLLHADRVCSTASIQTSIETYNLALIREDVRPIGRRSPYDESRYIEEATIEGQLCGRGALHNLATKKDLIRGIIALNKLIHDETVRRTSAQRYRWSFSSLEELKLPNLPAEIPSGNISRAARLLLKNVNAWTVEGNLHTVSEGHLEYEQSGACQFRIRFAGEPRST